MVTATAFVPESLVPRWIQIFNDWNPITYPFEVIRSLVITGYDRDAPGRALLAMGIMGLGLQAAPLRAFRRLTR